MKTEVKADIYISGINKRNSFLFTLSEIHIVGEKGQKKSFSFQLGLPKLFRFAKFQNNEINVLKIHTITYIYFCIFQMYGFGCPFYKLSTIICSNFSSFILTITRSGFEICLLMHTFRVLTKFFLYELRSGLLLSSPTVDFVEPLCCLFDGMIVPTVIVHLETNKI